MALFLSLSMLQVVCHAHWSDFVFNRNLPEALECSPAQQVAACTIPINVTATGAYLLDVLQAGSPIGCSSHGEACQMPINVTVHPQPAVAELSSFAFPGMCTTLLFLMSKVHGTQQQWCGLMPASQ